MGGPERLKRDNARIPEQAAGRALEWQEGHGKAPSHGSQAEAEEIA
jgi:hypothetical protein